MYTRKLRANADGIHTINEYFPLPFSGGGGGGGRKGGDGDKIIRIRWKQKLNESVMKPNKISKVNTKRNRDYFYPLLHRLFLDHDIFFFF